MATMERPTSARATLPLYGGACVSGSAGLAERVLAAQSGVRRVYANPTTEMAYVEYDPAATDPARLAIALAAAGLAERPRSATPPTDAEHSPPEPVPPSTLLLSAAGLMVVGVGLYFLFARPPMLPEDARYVCATLTQLEAAGPDVGHWLTRVFWVLGGYALATGLLTIYLAWEGVRRRAPYAGIATALAGTASVGLMAVVDVAIGSDLRWILLGLALLWATALGLYAARR